MSGIRNKSFASLPPTPSQLSELIDASRAQFEYLVSIRRRMACRMRESGMSIKAIAEEFEVREATVSGWLWRDPGPLLSSYVTKKQEAP